MQQSQVVFGFLAPADEQAAKAMDPAVGAFDDPAAGFDPGVAFELLGLHTPGAQMQGELKLPGQVPHLRLVVALVQAEPSWVLAGGAWPLDADIFQSFPRQLVIVAVGSGGDHAQWKALGFGDHTAFGAALGPVGGVGAGFFPRPREPWSSAPGHGKRRALRAWEDSFVGDIPHGESHNTLRAPAKLLLAPEHCHHQHLLTSRVTYKGEDKQGDDFTMTSCGGEAVCTIFKKPRASVRMVNPV